MNSAYSALPAKPTAPCLGFTMRANLRRSGTGNTEEIVLALALAFMLAAACPSIFALPRRLQARIGSIGRQDPRIESSLTCLGHRRSWCLAPPLRPRLCPCPKRPWGEPLTGWAASTPCNLWPARPTSPPLLPRLALIARMHHRQFARSRLRAQPPSIKKT